MNKLLSIFIAIFAVGSINYGYTLCQGIVYYNDPITFKINSAPIPIGSVLSEECCITSEHKFLLGYKKNRISPPTLAWYSPCKGVKVGQLEEYKPAPILLPDNVTTLNSTDDNIPINSKLDPTCDLRFDLIDSDTFTFACKADLEIGKDYFISISNNGPKPLYYKILYKDREWTDLSIIINGKDTFNGYLYSGDSVVFDRTFTLTEDTERITIISDTSHISNNIVNQINSVNDGSLFLENRFNSFTMILN